MIVTSRRFRVAMATLWTSLIIVGSLMSADSLGGSDLLPIPHFDKVLHLVAYGGFALLWLTALADQKWLRVATIIVVGLLTGLAVELMQKAWTVDRQYDILDIIANTAGLLLGLLAYIGLTKN